MEKKVFLGLLIGISIFTVIDASTVPVIAWSSTSNLFSTRHISAGEEISTESLNKDFLDKGLGNEHQTIIVVLLNKLSLGDVTRYGDAYESNNQGGVIPNIKTSMETSSSSLVLPQTDTSDLVDDLMSKVTARKGEIVEIADQAELESFNVDPTRTNLLIVRIDSSQSMEKQLATADGYVAAAMRLLKGKSTAAPFTVFFTAAQAPKHSSQSSGRRLLQTYYAADSGSNFTFINYTTDGCQVFLFAEYINVSLFDNGNQNGSLVLPSEGWTFDEAECLSNSSLNFGIKISDLKGPNGTDTWIYSVALLMKFVTTDMNFWYINETTITYKLTDGEEETDEVDLPDQLETPVGWSYHCGDITFTAANANRSLDMYFRDFQIQPFEIEEDKFSSANDCIGYFTAGIWMGLLTALLIIAIVGFGISMMATVRVMDKFDDPKGKQLVINVPES